MFKKAFIVLSALITAHLITAQSFAEQPDSSYENIEYLRPITTIENTITDLYFLDHSLQNTSSGFGQAKRFEMVYLGEKRIMPKSREFILRYWGEGNEHKPEIVDLFLTEMAFKEGENIHWLNVQEQVLTRLEKEVNVGDKVILDSGWVGAMHHEWVFLVYGFEKSKEETSY